MKNFTKIFIIVFAVLFITNSSAQEQRYIDKIFDNVDVQTLNYTDVHDLQVDIYQPSGDLQENRPLIIWVHGGAFLDVMSDRTNEQSTFVATEFAKRGYVVASIDYRLVTASDLVCGPICDSEMSSSEAYNEYYKDHIAQAYSDTKAAVRFFRKSVAEGNEFRINSDHFYMGGHSAGAIITNHMILEQQEDIFNINGHEMMSAISANGGIEGNSGNPGYSHEVEGGFSLSGAVLDLGVVTSQDFDKLYISVHGNADGVVPYNCDKPFGSFLIDFSYPFELAEQAYIEAQNTLTQTLESSNELSSSLSSLTEDMYEDLDAYSYAEAAWNEATSYLNTLDSEVCTYTPEVPSVELTPYIPAAIITPEIPESCTPEVWSPAVDATYSPYVPAVEAWVPEVCTPSIPAVYAPTVWVPEVCIPWVGCSGGYYTGGELITPAVPSTCTGGYWEVVTPAVPSVELTPYIPAALITPEICTPAIPAVWSPEIPATYSPYIPESTVCIPNPLYVSAESTLITAHLTYEAAQTIMSASTMAYEAAQYAANEAHNLYSDAEAVYDEALNNYTDLNSSGSFLPVMCGSGSISAEMNNIGMNNEHLILEGADHMFNQWGEGGKEQMIEFVAERLYMSFSEEDLGCLDHESINYSSEAIIDDGSCIAVVNGCTDPTSFNYNSDANTDDGSCIAIVNGCTDENAFNYNPLANTQNTECIPVILGCIDDGAYNFNLNANTDDESCILSLEDMEDMIQNQLDAAYESGYDEGFNEGFVSPASLIDVHLDLPSGWSMFGYTCLDSQNVIESLVSIASEIEIVKDEMGMSYLPDWGFDAIGEFSHGEGYQIKLYSTVEGFQFCKTLIQK